MSIWTDMMDRGTGDIQKKEDVPIHITKLNGSVSFSNMFNPVRYIGRVDGHSYNNFYPQGLGELYQVQEACRMHGIEFNAGDLIIGYYDEHWDTDYYLYKRKQPFIK